MSKKFLYLVCTMLFFWGFHFQSKAQWMANDHKHLEFGMSAGVGGLHGWGGPAFDVKYKRSTLRVSPGLWFLSVGVTQQIGFFQGKKRSDRILILTGAYMNDWLLSKRHTAEYDRDQNIYMLMPGIHVNLNHLGNIYMEVSAGPMYVHERRFSGDLKFVSDEFYPIAEIRFGGYFLSRKWHTQLFPHDPVTHPGKKPKKKKLKFKK